MAGFRYGEVLSDEVLVERTKPHLDINSSRQNFTREVLDGALSGEVSYFIRDQCFKYNVIT
jgi:hypothetical protein